MRRVRPFAVVVAARFGWPRHLLPVAVAGGWLLLFASTGALTNPVVTWPWTSELQMIGAVLIYIIMPGYLMACCVSQDGRAAAATALVAQRLRQDESWVERVRSVNRPVLWCATLLGAAWGYLNFAEFVPRIFESGDPLQNLVIVAGNVFIWIVIARTLAFRVLSATAMAQFGAGIDTLTAGSVDQLRPITQVATFDVLMVMGSFALMPLQTLDAEFRWANYEAGFIVGGLSGLALFFLPMSGVARRIADLRRRELERAHAALDAVGDADIVTLEPLLAYRDRVRALPALPVDLRIVTRILFYFVIPPLAWVAAAIVENWVSRYLGG